MKRGLIDVRHVAGEDNLADFFTKVLGVQRFRGLRDKILQFRRKNVTLEELKKSMPVGATVEQIARRVGPVFERE